MKLVPMERTECAEFVDRLHRHHDPVKRDRFRIGVEQGGGTRWSNSSREPSRSCAL